MTVTIYTNGDYQINNWQRQGMHDDNENKTLQKEYCTLAVTAILAHVCMNMQRTSI